MKSLSRSHDEFDCLLDHFQLIVQHTGDAPQEALDRVAWHLSHQSEGDRNNRFMWLMLESFSEITPAEVGRCIRSYFDDDDSQGAVDALLAPHFEGVRRG